MKRRTNRGFRIYSEFKDSYGSTVTVQESSAAMRSCCWVFVKNHKGEDALIHLGQLQGVSPHLTKPQAKRLANALLKFVAEAR